MPVTITEELLRKYRDHPRIMEIRFSVFFECLAREFGYDKGMQMFEKICSGDNRDSFTAQRLISQRFSIMRHKKINRVKWRQSVLFMALCYNQSLSKVCKYLLNCSNSILYRIDGLYSPTTFVTQEWLDSLDDEIVIAENPYIREQLRGMIITFDGLATALIGFNATPM